MKSMYKILGIFLILAAVSLSGCIGEDVPADVTDDVIVDDVVDEVVEDVVDAEEDVAEDVDNSEEEIVDDADDIKADEEDDNTVSLDEGTEGDYSSFEHFTELRDDARAAYNAAQALADDANGTMTAADAEVLRCEALVADGQALLDNESTAFVALNDANLTTVAALALFVPAEAAVAEAQDIADADLLATIAALEVYKAAFDADLADPANATVDETDALFDTYMGLKVDSDASADAVIPLNETMEELRIPLIAAEEAEAEAQTAYDGAVAAAAELSASEMNARIDAVVIAQEAADSARLAFETLQEAADEKLAALEAAQDKLDSIIE